MIEHPGSGELIDDRYCTKCIWHDEECMVWDCNFVSREGLRKAVKAGLDINGLIKEVQINGSY